MAHRQSQAQDTERTIHATDDVQAATQPKKGEVYRCIECGMELEITSDCKCPDAELVQLECCGTQLLRM